MDNDKISIAPSKNVSLKKNSEVKTQLQHNCELKFDVAATNLRQTAIIATIGTNCNSIDVLVEMMLAGATIFRINFSHDSHHMYEEYIKNIREAEELYSQQIGIKRHIAIAVDTKGPEIRTGLLEGARVRELELRAGDFIRLSTNKDLYDKGTRECIYVDYPHLVDISPGLRVFLDDSAILLIVKEIALDCIICQVEIGGPLGNHKSVSIPDVFIDLPPISEKDRFDIKFAIENHIDFIFASHILTREAIPEIRNLLGEKGKHIKIIGKIENTQCIQILDDIIAAADGIIFARADLSIQMSTEHIFLLQKALTARCNRAAKPVIIATHFFERMRSNVRPTWSELVDVGNAVIDGADCIMLSSETSIGQHPLEVIKATHSMCQESEKALWFRNFFAELLARNPALLDAAHAIAIAAVDAAQKTSAAAIIVLTASGRSAQLISAYRPHCPLIAVTKCPRTARQCNIHRGIIPLLFNNHSDSDWIRDTDNRLNFALLVGKKMEVINIGDPIILISPWKAGDGFTNNMRIVYAFFEAEPFDCMFKDNAKNSINRPSMQVIKK